MRNFQKLLSRLVFSAALIATIGCSALRDKNSAPPPVLIPPPPPPVTLTPPKPVLPPPPTAATPMRPPEIVGKALGAAPSAPERNDVVPVLFATNRNKTGIQMPYYFYGNELSANATTADPLQRGIAAIKVPANHTKGDVKRANTMRVTLSLWTESELASRLGIAKIRSENPETDFSYQAGIKELNASAFDQALRNAVAKSKSKTAVLYVHGYANDFTDAAFRTAQIAFDLATPDYDVVPLMFSWPSDPGPVKMNYNEARNNRIGASSKALENFLLEIKNNTDIGTVHIIAHSMGAEVLGQAMKNMGISGLAKNANESPVKPLFKQIIFAAPDITVKTFNEVIEPAVKTNHTITTYGAKTDIALWLSSLLNKKDRVGRILSNKVFQDCIDTIDITAVTGEGDFLSHSTWAESPRVLNDLRFLLRDGLNASSRKLRLNEDSWALLKTDPPSNAKLPTRTAPKIPPGMGCNRQTALK
jgi:esterase/lipase superfamily enzyme